jgi:hypothetical protein
MDTNNGGNFVFIRVHSWLEICVWIGDLKKIFARRDEFGP